MGHLPNSSFFSAFKINMMIKNINSDNQKNNTTLVLNLLFNRSILAILGSILQRATPIILGAIVLRLVGEKSLFEHNTWFIAASICAALTAGGLSPHLLRKFSSFKGLRERDALPSLAFACLFGVFIIGYSILKGELPSLLFLMAAFAFGRMMISVAIMQARAQLLRVALFQLSFLILTILISVSLLLAVPSASWVFYVAYGVAALPAGLATVKVIPVLPGIISKLNKKDLVEIINFSLYGTFGVAVGFMVLLYLQEYMRPNDYNQLVFTYQLYSFIIFIPGILSVVTVPLLSRSGLVNTHQKNFLLPLIYCLYALPITLVASMNLDTIASLYGFQNFISKPSLYFIIYAAIPTSIVAGLNQMNIVSQRSYIPLIAIVLGNLTLVLLMAFYISAENYGYAMFAGVCVNAGCSLLITLLKQKSVSL